MTIAEPAPSLVQRATQGDLGAIDNLLRTIQSGVFNLAVRMLGNRDDAADATQDILLQVVTHLATFRGEARFSTWVFQIARRHLMAASTRSRESPEVSLEAIADKLGQGLAWAERLQTAGAPTVLSPADKLEARQTGLACTQGMLMALDRDHRLAYLLDQLFGLSSVEAAEVCGISPALHRQRLARARQRLDGFFHRTCGLANPQAACRCERQAPVLRLARAQGLHPEGAPRPLAAETPAEQAALEAAFDGLKRLGDAAEVLRAHPEYAAPAKQLGAIRQVLGAEGWLGPAGLKH
jgi:RNA polymerase sigma factor (sigma-70 family)